MKQRTDQRKELNEVRILRRTSELNIVYLEILQKNGFMSTRGGG